jgi:hypothetical protein
MSVVINGNGQVSGFIVGAEDLDPNAIPPSDSLKKSITLATGGSVTAAKAVAIDSNGETGLYPDLNVLSSAQAHTSATNNEYTVSGNGRVGAKLSSSASASWDYTYTIYGIAFKDDGTSSESGTTFSFDVNSSGVNSEGGGAGYFGHLHDNYFVCVGTAGGRDGGNWRSHTVKVVTFSVDESTGVPTKIQESTVFSGTQNGTSYSAGKAFWLTGSGDFASPNAGGSKEWHLTGYHAFSNPTTYYAPVVCEIASDGTFQYSSPSYSSALAFGSLGSGTHLSSGSIDVVYEQSGSTWVYKTRTWNAYNSIGTTVSSTAFLSDVDTGTSAVYDDDYLIVFYRKVTGEYYLNTYTINSSTGAPTLVDTFELAISSSVTLSNYQLSIRSATEFAFGYRVDGGLYYINTGEVDGSVNIVGTNFPISLGTSGSNIRYDDTNSKYRIFYFASNWYDYDLTSTSASTSTFVYGGIANETASSGSVDIVVAGVASGFTGLTPAANYYIDPSYDGSISTNTQTGVYVGRAISDTEILVNVTSA